MKKKPIKLNANERIIIAYAIENPRFTLDDLTVRFLRSTKEPRGWSYAEKVGAQNRRRWLANLRARNGIRRLFRERLVRKIRPGIYAVTSAGVASL